MTRRKLAMGRNRLCALRDAEGNMTHDMNDILKIAEEVYGNLFACGPDAENSFIIAAIGQVPAVTTEEVATALKGMKKGKAAGHDGITVDPLCHSGDVVVTKLEEIFSQCLSARNVPQAWKNANLILLHKRGDAKELKNYRPISLLSVTYRLFRKVILNRLTATLDFERFLNYGSYPYN